MKFAIFTLSEQPDGQSASGAYRAVIEQAVAAEELGFDAVWLAEHHFTEYGVVPSVPVLGTAIAEHTSQIRIGSAIAVLPFHDPRRLAEDYAMLDVLSDGRLDFGVGRGYQPAEFEAFGISMDESRSRFEEAIDVIEGLWTQESFSYHGRHFSFDDLTIHPRPVQSPPPMWVAAVSPSTFEFAARARRPFLSAPQITPLPKIREGYEHYREAYAAAGGDPSTVTLPLQRNVYVGATKEAAYSEPAEAYMWYQRMNASRMARDGQKVHDYEFYEKAQRNLLKVEYDQLFDSGALLFGTSEEIVDRITHLKEELDLNYLMCWMGAGGLRHDLVLSSMERFAREVMPHFKESDETVATSAGVRTQ